MEKSKNKDIELIKLNSEIELLKKRNKVLRHCIVEITEILRKIHESAESIEGAKKEIHKLIEIYS
jgi:predicted  nucleic acid-binding Zn-ribbon protein